VFFLFVRAPLRLGKVLSWSPEGIVAFICWETIGSTLCFFLREIFWVDLIAFYRAVVPARVVSSMSMSRRPLI